LDAFEFGRDGGFSVFPYAGGRGSGRLYVNVTGFFKLDGAIDAKGMELAASVNEC